MENIVKEAAVKYAITQQEYLEAERAATGKHEYFRGEIFAMSGASYRHNRISMNLAVSIGSQLKGKNCTPLGSGMRIHIPFNSLFTYPDISIVCGKPELLDDGMDTLLNPAVIIEILSPSTRRYDRGIKFNLYRDIPCLQEYILIEQEMMLVEQWLRQPGNSWQSAEYNSAGETLSFTIPQVAISLEEIYEGITFP